MSFTEVSKQVHLIDNLILAEMICGRKDYYEDSIEFSKHLLLTKFWFMRVSWKNKRQLLLMLVEDVKSIWTLSVLLKSIWNSRPKDAVSSVCGKQTWSSYDQVPMDHNRTALPVELVEEAMINERNWFSELEPEQQALVISELLTVAGGPIMWEVLGTAQKIYEKHKERQLQEIIEYAVVEPEKAKVTVEQAKKDTPRVKGSFSQGQDQRQTLLPGQAQKELDLALATWNSTVKSIRDGYKLEEIEIKFKDETKRTIWKVNRPKPENIETVDYLQLLPSVIAKQILLYIPQTQYGDLSRVNKYWSFLIDEIKAETLARQKINVDLEKLRDIILRHDTELGMMNALDSDLGTSAMASNTKATSVVRKALPPFSMREKTRKHVGTFKPLRKLSDIYKRLDQRGAADENIWKWCSNILKLNQQISDHNKVKNENEGTLSLRSLNFPCPLMAYNINIPLEYPLVEDPTMKYVAIYKDYVKGFRKETPYAMESESIFASSSH